MVPYLTYSDPSVDVHDFHIICDYPNCREQHKSYHTDSFLFDYIAMQHSATNLTIIVDGTVSN